MELEIIKPLRRVYSIVKDMKKNDEDFPDILYRVRALIDLVMFIKEKEHLKSDDTNRALENLVPILKSAQKLVDRFSEAGMVAQLIKSSGYRTEFDKLSKSLTDAFVTLSGALHLNQDKRLAEQEEEVHEQQKKLAQYEERLAEQQKTLYIQQKTLFMQKMELTELQHTLQRLESKSEYESSRSSCILQ